MRKFLIGFNFPKEILNFSHSSLQFSHSDVIDATLTEATVKTESINKAPDSFLYDFCILASLFLNRPITVRAQYEESLQSYRVTPRYLDHFSLENMPKGPQPIFTNINATLASEFDRFSKFIQKNPERVEDFIYYHNTLILRSDVILGFSAQVILLERLINRFIKDNKIEIPIKDDQKGPTLFQKITSSLETLKISPFFDEVDTESKNSGISYLKKISKSRNDLFHGNNINVDPNISRVIFEINRRLLLNVYGSKSSLVTSCWTTIGSSLIKHK